MAALLEGEPAKRERQVVETVFRLKEATVAEVLETIPEAPSYSSLRATMNNLVRKGLLAFRRDGKRFVYRPAVSAETARKSAVRKLLDTYFGNSPAAAVSALLTLHGREITPEEYEELARLIDEYKQGDRG